MADKNKYVGRLECDGAGNLLASEVKQVGTKLIVIHNADGEVEYDSAGNEMTLEVPVLRFGKNHGRPVAHDLATDTYVFLEDGDPSHNEQHHEQHVEVVGTQHVDEDAPGYAGTPAKPAKGAEHHFGTLPDDPHFSEGAQSDAGLVTNTVVINDTDKVAISASSHTEQPREDA